jgi:sugar/nucleoside kinase (ribokinase family)
MKGKKVIVAGHLCLDLIPAFDDSNHDIETMFKPGMLTNVGEMKMSTGGAVSNTGIALTRAGADVVFIGKTGNDEFGRIIIDILKEHASVDGLKISEKESSSYTIVLAPMGIDRILFHNPGTNDTFTSGDINFGLLRDAELLHFGYPPLMRGMYSDGGRELTKIFESAKKEGVVTSMDMALPDPNSEAGKADWVNILKSVLPHVDIFAPSVEEILYMVFKDEYDYLMAQCKGADPIDKIDGKLLGEISDLLLEWGAGVVLIKCGHKGIYIRTGGEKKFDKMGKRILVNKETWLERELWMPAFHREKIANAAGSGDCSIAGFIAAFIQGEEIDKCVRYAALMGYQNLAGADAFSGIKSWNETREMARDYAMPTIPLEPDTKGWAYDDKLQIWAGPHDAEKGQQRL